MTRKPKITSEGAAAAAAPARAKKTGTHTRRTAAVPVESSAVEIQLPTLDTAPATYGAYDEIARLAYSYYEARGYQGGSPEEDWLRAEQELRARNR